MRATAVVQYTSRRRLLLAGAAVAAAPGRIRAQQPGRTYRLGWLSAGASRAEGFNNAFVERLRELGFVAGRNLVIEIRSAQGVAEHLPAIATELVKLNCDVLFVPGPEVALIAAKQASRDTPIIVAANDYDPVATGHVASLAKPGGRITGVTQLQVQLAAKRLEVLCELLPTAKRVAVFADIATVEQLAVLKAAAPRLAVALDVVDFKRGPYDYEAAFAAIVRRKAEALMMLGSAFFAPARVRICELALAHRLPGAYNNYLWAEAGGLISYGANFSDTYRRAADKVAQVLKGVKPADIPMEQPSTVEMVVNLKTARALGVTIPASIAARADRAIQ